MTLVIDWISPKRILYVYTSSDLPLEEWGGIQADILHHLDHGIAPVHVIIDTELSPSVESIRNIRSISGLRPVTHPNMGWVIIVQNNLVIRFFSPLVLQIYAPNTPYQMVYSTEEALKALKHRDPSLHLEAILAQE